MNQQLAERIVKRFENTVEENISKYIQKYIPNPGESITMTPEALQDQLYYRNYEWIQRSLEGCDLRASQLQSGQFSIKLLKWLSKFQKISSIFLWNCRLNSDFFEALAETQWQLQYIILQKCFMDSDIARCLGALDLSKVLQIRLGSSPISNKSIKNFMKLSMPNIQQISIENTCITTDFVKTLNKCPHNYSVVSVPTQKHFNCLFFFQKVISMFANFSGVGIIMQIGLVYLPHVAKLPKLPLGPQLIVMAFNVRESIEGDFIQPLQLEWSKTCENVIKEQIEIQLE